MRRISGPQRIRMRRTRTRTWSRTRSRSSWFCYRTWTPFHNNHSRTGARVHGASGRGRRILCDTTPGAACPGPSILEPHEEVLQIGMHVIHAVLTYPTDISARHALTICESRTSPYAKAGPRHQLHQTECAAVHRPGVQLRN